MCSSDLDNPQNVRRHCSQHMWYEEGCSACERANELGFRPILTENSGNVGRIYDARYEPRFYGPVGQMLQEQYFRATGVDTSFRRLAQTLTQSHVAGAGAVSNGSGSGNGQSSGRARAAASASTLTATDSTSPVTFGDFLSELPYLVVPGAVANRNAAAGAVANSEGVGGAAVGGGVSGGALNGVTVAAAAPTAGNNVAASAENGHGNGLETIPEKNGEGEGA